MSQDLGTPERIEVLWQTEQVRIERIVSTGQSSPPGFWYDQEEDEFVMLLQGTAMLDFDGGRRQQMEAGDFLLIPAHEKHRIAATSFQPPCIWLCVFLVGKNEKV